MIGQTISHYRIVEKLGGGGMGVVYKAEDTRLHRFVALKFLPDEVAQDPQALARFQREAQAASALNHPNICTIYDIGEENGQAFIAMEFLDGQTLKHLIGNRPLELETLLSLAIEIADALDAAHAEGIVHRDIKPANIFVTKRGHAKILDFGLAKIRATVAKTGSEATETGAGDPNLTSSGYGGGHGRLHVSGAGAGQGTGRPHGLVLLRRGALRNGDGPAALSRRQFGGDLRRDSESRSGGSGAAESGCFPPSWNDIINKALEKDRELRYQDAAEMRADLKRLKRETETGTAGSSQFGRRCAVAQRDELSSQWLSSPSPGIGFEPAVARHHPRLQ